MSESDKGPMSRKRLPFADQPKALPSSVLRLAVGNRTSGGPWNKDSTFMPSEKR